MAATGLLVALALGLAASLAVAKGGGDASPKAPASDTQTTPASDAPIDTTQSDTPTDTTQSDTPTDTTTLPGGGSDSGRSGQGGSAGRFVVVLKDSTGDPEAVAQEHGRRYGVPVDLVYTRAIKGYATRLSNRQLEQVRNDADVDFVSKDREVKATGTTALASGESTPTGVRRIEAATGDSAHGASSASVAVIDTGISLSHPDLKAVSGKNCVKSGKSANDDNGHGTHVAGTIAATNSGSGVVGVAPGTKLFAVKVLNRNGSGTWSQVICGIEWVTSNAAGKGIKVANLSLGGPGSDDHNCGNSNADALHKAICKSTAAGVTYVVAAGNAGQDEASSVPATYDEVLSVTAVSDSDGQPGGSGGAPSCRTGESDDKYASFSNFAASGSSDESHTIAAPGVCIRSTWLNGGYNTISGTSMAAPHVTGSIALCCAGMNPPDAIGRLRQDADPARNTAVPDGYGFKGDPASPVSGRYFGYLTWDGGY